MFKDSSGSLPEVCPSVMSWHEATVTTSRRQPGRKKAGAKRNTRPEGAGLITHEQSWRQHQQRVYGYGPQAQAALVDYLHEEGFHTAAFRIEKRCCSAPLPGANWLTVKEREGGKRHVGGLSHCGRMTCPICAPYLMARRMEALAERAKQIALDENLRHFFFTLSLRHHNGANWLELFRALRKIQKSLREGHRWKGLVAGFLRFLETTFGKNGHNPHEHILASLCASLDWDPEPFFEWVHALAKRQASKAGRTLEWTEGWWKEVSREELAQTVKYLGSADKMGTASRGILRELTGAATKHQPVWTIPAAAYVEVDEKSKGLRWFGTGGIWKDKTAEKTDEELNAEREVEGKAVGHVTVLVWNSWTKRERRDRLAVVYDRELKLDDFLRAWRSWGGQDGPPPDPWGDIPTG